MAHIDISKLVDGGARAAAKRPNPILLVLKRLVLGVRLRKLEPFYFQLATMLSAGVSVLEALHTLAEQHRGRAGKVFGHLAEQVQLGGQLTPALEAYPETFDRFAIAMVRTGEQAGKLDENLLLVGQAIEKFRNLRSKVITALIYPFILIHLAVLIPNLLVLVKFGAVPYIEVCLETLIPVWIVLLVLWLLHQVLRQTRTYAEFILGMFFFGGVAKKIALARLSRALASMNDAGVPLGVAVEAAAEASTNGAISEAFVGVAARLRAGNSFTDSIQDIRFVTPLTRNMVETGERTGRLGDTLRKLADYYDHEAYTAIERAARIIPILIYCMVAGYIGWRVISFYLGYYGPFIGM